MDNQSKICLAVSHLSKHYGDQQILHNLSFSLNPGEILGIIGPNGAGKTTLFNIITGWVPPSEGKVFFLGENTTAWAPDRLGRAGMARTFQVPQVFPEMHVLENVMTGAWFGQEPRPSKSQARDQSRELLELVGLTAKEAAPARELTLMQQRLLELARALATRPKLLLLDEIAAGLSLKAVQCLSHLILRLRGQGLTLLLTDHLLNLIVPVCDRLLALDQGEIIAAGLPQDIMHHPKVESAYLGGRTAAREEG
jgi:branched-chain amino acid transport system ATP-binding protein